jgi:hypothetical protein
MSRAASAAGVEAACTGFLMPIHDTTPPITRKAAVAIAARWKPSTSSWLPTMTPMEAIATRPAMRATALLTAEPMPASRASIEPRMAEVSGATVIERPSPNSSTPAP